MKPKGLDLLFSPAMALPLLAALAATPALFAAEDPLLFPKDAFTVETKTVKTSQGEKTVTYRSYKHIPYVASPVDKDYQSLDVNVPVKIDGVAIDAASAPILFNVAVGGYMSASNAGRGNAGGRGPGGPGGPGGRGPGGPGGRGPGMGGPPAGAANTSGKLDLALAAGYVVVLPGCRGRDNQAADGAY